MIIECNYCEAIVDAKVVGYHDDSFDPDAPFPARISLVVCPICNSALVGCEDLEDDEKRVSRVWPSADKHYVGLPRGVAVALEESRKCFKAKAYTGCVVMCGKALEGLCVEHKMKHRVLGKALNNLLQKGIIDKRIFDWGDEIRKHRNIGAHFSEEKISKEDAKDLLDFTEAICDYVFVLTEKFDDFMKRKKKMREKII